MNVYWDTSALIKLYILEAGTKEAQQLITRDTLSATAVITRAEVAGVFSRAFAKGIITRSQMTSGLAGFRRSWPDYLRLRVTESVIRNADFLAVEYSLRGYDATHLAAALVLMDRLETVRFATFDDNLWKAASTEGFHVFPERLPSEFLKSLRRK